MRSVLITGVSGGIGKATAQHLILNEWKVYGADIKESDIAHELAGFWQGDISEESFWTTAVLPDLENIELFGLVNCAAIQPCRSIQTTSLEEWNQTLEVNLTAIFLSTKHLSRLLSIQNGAIVNVSSVHATATSAGMAAYVASKGGVQAFTRAAALELAEEGIRVNAVAPGAVETGMLNQGMKRQNSDLNKSKQSLIEKTPMSKIGRPQDISHMIEFLLDSNRSSFITAQSFVVDGGVLSKLSSE